MRGVNRLRADPIGLTEASIAYRAELMAAAAVRLQAVTLAHSRGEIAKPRQRRYKGSWVTKEKKKKKGAKK